MRERPIIFSAPMVRALLEGRKTQTRRITKPQPLDSDVLIRKDETCEYRYGPVRDGRESWDTLSCPFGKPGDRLWVREAVGFADGFDPSPGDPVWYRADEPSEYGDHLKWRPSIHMPRWASRITLELTGVRVERLQEIGEQDAKAEGIRYHEASRVYGDGICFGTAKEAFSHLWGAIHGAGAWKHNPWLWVLQFQRINAAVS